jgi:hypothetical protein
MALSLIIHMTDRGGSLPFNISTYVAVEIIAIVEVQEIIL